MILFNFAVAARYRCLDLVSSVILSGMTPLLEGHLAATGKSSSIQFLADCSGNHLEATATTQKRLAFLIMLVHIFPTVNSLQEALARAMMNGDWFLCDEFDLAEPAINNILYPLIEGQNYLRVPNSSIVFMASTGFRFFATQNGSTYAGRHEAPITLRSRFIRIDFPPFLRRSNYSTSLRIGTIRCDSMQMQLRRSSSRLLLRPLLPWWKPSILARMAKLYLDHRYWHDSARSHQDHSSA